MKPREIHSLDLIIIKNKENTMKQLHNFVSIKECGKTLGISKSAIKNMTSKNIISWKIVEGNYMVDVYEIIHYLSNNEAIKNWYLFLNKVVCDVIDGLDKDIQEYDLLNKDSLQISTIVDSYKNNRFYCDTSDVNDLMRNKHFISKFKKHYYELDFKGNKNPNKNYIEKLELSKSLPLIESIEYKVSIILDYFNTYPLLSAMRITSKIMGGTKSPMGYTF